MSIQDLTLGLVETAKRIAEDSAAYKKFFNDSLKKFGVTSPEELSAEKKKEFYNHIDANWNSDDEPGSDGKKDKPKKDVDEGKGMPPWLKKGKKDDKDSEDEVKEEHDEEDEDEDEEEVEEGLNAQYKKDLKASACKSEEIKEEDWSKMGDRSKDWTRRQYQKAVAAGDKERAKDFIDTYGRGVTKKVGHGQDAQGKEIGKFGDKAFKKRIDNIKKKKDEDDKEVKESNTLDANLLERVLKELNIGDVNEDVKRASKEYANSVAKIGTLRNNIAKTKDNKYRMKTGGQNRIDGWKRDIENEKKHMQKLKDKWGSGVTKSDTLGWTGGA